MTRPLALAVLLLSAAAGRAAESATTFSFAVGALVQAGPARWREIPGDAVIPASADRLRRPFLESGPGIPVRGPAVRKALAAALAPVAVADRRRLRPVLDAIGDWAVASLAEEPGPVPCPAGWRDAARVLADGRGHAFERARALTALARAAGISARPVFNGVAAVAVFVKPRGAPGAWTVWDPFHPGDAIRRLPVGWLPLRAGDPPPVSIAPAPVICGPLTIEVRRYAARDAAARDLEAIRTTGAFPLASPPPPGEDAPAWWEVWSLGAAVVPPPTRWTAVVALPYVRELGYGTREHVVWVSDPSRRPAVTGPLSETDGATGGIVMTLKLGFTAAGR